MATPVRIVIGREAKTHPGPSEVHEKDMLPPLSLVGQSLGCAEETNQISVYVILDVPETPAGLERNDRKGKGRCSTHKLIKPFLPNGGWRA